MLHYRMEGWINFYKEKGPTSFQCVHWVKQRLKKGGWMLPFKIGHTGTLDPTATGVLVLALGRSATKRIGDLVGTKRYRAIVCLGATTPTGDQEGKVTQKGDPPVSLEEIEPHLPSFLGTIEQTPPLYSAIHYQGKRLYQYARQGKHVEIQPRSVTIYTLEVEEYTPPLLTLTLSCSAGTYVRSLACALGDRLGCGGYLYGLERTQAHGFSVDESWKKAQLEPLLLEGPQQIPPPWLIPLDRPFTQPV